MNNGQRTSLALQMIKEVLLDEPIEGVWTETQFVAALYLLVGHLTNALAIAPIDVAEAVAEYIDYSKTKRLGEAN